MNNELKYNGSGYYDPTAYKALKNIERMEKRMLFKRGEIYEYESNNGIMRLALVISADFRANDRYLSVILLTEEPKGEIVVPVVGRGMMYADCGMVSFAANDRLLEFVKCATQEEMDKIDEGIMECLGLESKTVENSVKIPDIQHMKVIESVEPHAELFSEELATAKAEANIYKELYEKLLAKVVG